MNIGDFFSTTAGKVASFLGTVLGGAIIVKARDFVLVKLIGWVNPDKYIDIIIGSINLAGNKISKKIDKIGDKIPIAFEDIDVKYIDPFKKKNPEAGVLLEKKLARALNDTGVSLSKQLRIVANEIEGDFAKAANNVLDK